MNNKNNKLRGYLRPEDDEARVEAWGWPEMETESEIESNALGLSPDWYRQEQEQEAPPEEPVEEPAPSITAEELEAIRQAAWEEGMREGREAGFAKGLEEGKRSAQAGAGPAACRRAGGHPDAAPGGSGPD